MKKEEQLNEDIRGLQMQITDLQQQIGDLKGLVDQEVRQKEEFKGRMTKALDEMENTKKEFELLTQRLKE